MDGNADDRDDGEASVSYRFARGASLGEGPEDPRWDTTDAGQGSSPSNGATGGSLPQRTREQGQGELPPWNAFGRPSAPAPQASPFVPASPWQTSEDEHTGSNALSANGYRPSPFRHYDEPAPAEDLWSDDADPEQQRWGGLAGHDDHPDWGGLAGHDDRPPWRPAQVETPAWGAQPRWGGPAWWNGDQVDGPSGELISVGVSAPEAMDRRGELGVSPQRGARRPAADTEQRRKGRGSRTMPLWQELPLLLVVAFCLAVLIRTFLLQAFYIPSGSMENTLLIGDRVLVNKVVYDLRTPQRGEVIVFSGPSNWTPENVADPDAGMLSRVGGTLGDLVGVSRPGEKDFIKRVIGLPGDRVSCCDPDGRIYVNGQGVDEPYVDNNSPLDVPSNPHVCSSRRFEEVLVPPGQLFVMGDHRIVSQDSRCQGTIPIENVIGRAFAIVWPSSRWGGLGVPDTFNGIPGPVAVGPPAAVFAPVAPVPGDASVGAAIITLPVVASLAKTRPRARKRRWPPRTLSR